MSELIYKNDGKPFKDVATAKSVMVRKKLEGAKIIKLVDEDGYAILTAKEEALTAPSLPIQQEEKNLEPKPPEAPVQTEAESPDVKVTETWRPKNATEIPEEFKDPGFDYKFEYNHKRAINDNLRNKWVIDRDVAQKMRDAGLLFADASCDSTFIVGDTILMKLPKTRAEARRRYYRERTMDGMKKKKAEYDAKLRDCGIEKSVGDGIHMSRGIVG